MYVVEPVASNVGCLDYPDGFNTTTRVEIRKLNQHQSLRQVEEKICSASLELLEVKFDASPVRHMFDVGS